MRRLIGSLYQLHELLAPRVSIAVSDLDELSRIPSLEHQVARERPGHRRLRTDQAQERAKWQRQLVDATNIDRLNIGPMPTIKLNWLQPHEGSIVDFLFRARAFQSDALVGKAKESAPGPSCA